MPRRVDHLQEKELKALQSVLRRDDVDAVRDFMKSFPSISAEEVLAQAAEACAANAVRYLLQVGANPDHHLPTALVLAIESGCHEVFDDLLDAGADLGSDPWWEDGDHPLTSAAAIADPVAMKWLCEKGAVEIADPQWLWETLALLGSSRKRTSAETLVVFGPRLLGRLAAGEIKIETSPLAKAAAKLRRFGKKTRNSDAINLASSLAELTDAEEAEEDEIIELTRDNRFEDLLSFIQSTGPARRSRRAGLGLLWGIRKEVWMTNKIVEGVEQTVPDPGGHPYLETLLEMEPDVHLTDSMGRTALMYAAWLAELEICRRLVDLGADIEAVDWESGRSVLDWARLWTEAEPVVAWIEETLRKR